MNDGLEKNFHQEMLAIYEEATTFGYHPTYFVRMVQQHGGVGAAKKLLRKGITDGLKRLAREGRMYISIEQLVLTDPWDQLFTEEEKDLARWAIFNDGKF